MLSVLDFHSSKRCLSVVHILFNSALPLVEEPLDIDKLDGCVQYAVGRDFTKVLQKEKVGETS